MIRRFATLTLALALATPVLAQAPEGWQMRLDRSTNAADPDNTPDVKFTKVGKGMQVVGGPAVTIWHANNNATGTYTLKGTFTLNKPSGHNNLYGLTFGGGDQGGAGQNYMYFVIGQDGRFYVAHRAGNDVHPIQPKTAHAAIVKPDATGKSVNNLEVRVLADKVDYVVNGQVVHTQAKGGVKTDGIWGARINHQLDVQIADLGVSK